MFPAVELDKQIPSYGDIIQDRINDIRFHDRTVYDEKVALLVSDYVSLTNTLMDLCKRLLVTNNDAGNIPISQIDLARQLLDTEENDKRSESKSKLDNILINFIEENENNKEGNSENVISRILGQERI